MTHRHALIPMCALLTLFLAGEAFALDGYRDRRSVFGGMSLGGGVGMVESGTVGEASGLDQGRRLGFHLNGIMGTGISRNLLFGLEANWWARTVVLQDVDLEHHHLSLNATANFFLIEGLYLDGGAGIAYGYSGFFSGNQARQRGEMGLALKGGAGVEFFSSADMTIGIRANYTRHFYANSNFDTISGAFSVRWY